jgi:hypothetical protein
VPTDKEVAWIQLIRRENLYPYMSQNKERITTWIAYWPISMVTYFIADFLIEVAKFVWRRVSNMFNFATQKLVYGDVPERYWRQ